MLTVMPPRELDRLTRAGLSADDFRDLPIDPSGITAVDRMGEEVGTVDDALVDPASLRTAFLMVSDGGVLGVGRHMRLVPLDAVERLDNQLVVIDRDRDLIQAAPAYRDDFSEDDRENHYLAVYDLYGVEPYWQRGLAFSGSETPNASSAGLASDEEIDHAAHDDHAHVHTLGRGHETRRHDDHDDFEHDGHWHAKHGSHYDEHGDQD